MTGEETRVVFVAGLSGSGKSTAMAALEDLSFYCVDNLPPQLVQQFIDLCAVATPPIRKIALAVDSREAPFLRRIPETVEAIREAGTRLEFIFLDCADDALVNRYRETRRVHPLSPTGSVEEGITREREQLAAVAGLADFRIDTSDLNVHELRSTVIEHVSGRSRRTVVRLVSFGFRYGLVPFADTVFDVRFLPNPYFEDSLRGGTGLDAPVAEYVMKGPRSAEFLERVTGLLTFLLPLYDQEGKAYLTIGIGCTGGRHRSVAIVEALAAALGERGREVSVDHRDYRRGEGALGGADR
ncbi:MAG: RNase adapter RapZ [Myxococcota bacterium]